MAAITALLGGIWALVATLSSRDGKPPLITISRVLLGLLIAGAGAIAMVWAVRSGYLPQGSIERVLSVQEVGSAFVGEGEEATDGSVEGRVKSYDYALEMFNSRPFIGYGTGSFAVIPARTDSDMRGFEYPHNLFLQAASEFGVVGILLIGALVVTAIRRGMRLASDRAWLAVLCLAVFLTLGALVSNGIVDNRTMWGPLVLLLAAPVPERETARKPRPSEAAPAYGGLEAATA
jgi:O-antigen ligase